MAERIADNINLERVVWFLTAIAPSTGGNTVRPSPPSPPGGGGSILQEDGSFIVLEDGTGNIIQE